MKNLLLLLIGILVIIFLAAFALQGKKIEYVSHGERVHFGNHLEGSNDIVVFQFTASWCGPCQQIKPHVKELTSQYDNVHYKLINIIDWQTPAARQMLEDFGGTGIPFFVVYDGGGNALASGNYNNMVAVIQQYGK